MLLNLHWLDLSIVSIYLLFCLYLGYSKVNKIKTLTEYAVGSRTISTLALITAVFATKIGAGATMGEIERVYSLGLFFAVTLMISPMFWFITAKIFAGNIDKFKDCISLTDIMRKLYGNSGRWFTVFASLIDSLGSVSAQLSAIGFLFQYLLDLPMHYGIIFAGALVCAYVSFGGAKSVILTDIFQFIVFYAVMPIACVLAVKSSGGFDRIITSLPSDMLEFNLEGGNKWVFLSFLFYALLPATSATFVQRFLMSRNSHQLGYSLNSIALIAFPFALILCAVGFTIRAVAPDIQSNSAFYYLIVNYLPVGVIGLSISAVFAIIMSSANSWLNSGATIIANDVIRSFLPNMTDKQGLLYARLATIGITILSILLAIIGGSIIKILWFTDSFWFPVMLVPLAAGMFGFRSTGKTFAVSAISAIVAVNIVALIMGEYNTLSITLGILTSFVTYFGFHFFFVAHPHTKKAFFISMLRKLGKRLASLIPTQKLFTGRNTIKVNSSNYIMFCTFVLYQYIPSMFDTALSEGLFFNAVVYVKISVILFAFLLFAFENWSAKTQKYIAPIFWHFNIFYALCFTSSLMLIVNSDKTLWVINLLLCITLLIHFLSVRTSIYYFISGFTLALISSKFFQEVHTQMIAVDIITQALPIIYGIVGIILIFVVRKGLEQKKELAETHASFIAHEAITPLAAMNISASMFNDVLRDAELSKNKKYYKLEKKNWKTLSNIAARLAETSSEGIARLNAVLNSKNNTYNDVGCYQMNDILDEILDEFSDSNRVKALSHSNFLFYGSKEGIKTVLSNLVRNALKYAGEHATVTIITNRDNEIVVEDNGFGIPPAIKKGIFKESVTTAGSGYGLMLCKKIIDDHNGSITLVSHIDQGTKFIIKL